MEMEETSKQDEISTFGIILSQMKIAAFKFIKEGYFTPICKPPDWFCSLYNQKIDKLVEDNQYDLAAAFPFVENFLFDAEKMWHKPQASHLHSGLWTEVQENKTELYLEAIAINAANTSVLLLTNETANFDLRHKTFQSARNLALQNEQLENIVRLHQRQLQQQLESFCHKQLSFSELNKNIEEESSAVLICRQDGGIEIYNKALIDIYTFTDNAEFKSLSLLDKWVKEAERLYPEIHRVLEVGKHWEGEFETSSNNNLKKWIRLMIAPVINNDHEIEHYICIANDISNIKISLSEIEKLTQIDATTGLPNRKSFWNYLSEKIDQKKLHGGNLALFYIDLDQFKQINDDLGPEQGDFVLKTVASRLKRCLKNQDYVAHLGADEFAIIVTEYNTIESLKNIAQRVIDGIYREVSFNELTLNVSASIGISVFPLHGATARKIVKNADYAMYYAKEMGRNQYQLYGPEKVRKGISRLHIEQGLKNAIENNEFELLYQPQICIGPQSIHRAEALIRWNNPTFGVISPADFIFMAEESGLIIDIGRWVIMTACKEIQRLTNKNLNVRISINVSPKQFKYSNLAEDIIKNLKEFSIDPKRLELEVTESAFMENMEDLISQLNEIRSLGVSISLDDFGTGYSSLSYLKSLPADQLKIDRSFISELPESIHCKTIVKSLIGLAHELSIEVIAEGVENQQQLDYLKKLECDYFQGYLFYAPLTADELLAMYESLTLNK